MIIDSKGKLFGKVSIIDILILLIIVAGIAGVYLKMHNQKSAGLFTKNTTKIEMTFIQKEVDNKVADTLKEGDQVKDAIKGTVLGKITKIEKSPAISYSVNQNGQIIRTSKPDYSCVLIYVEAKGVMGDFGVTVGNSEYAVGQSFEIRCGKVSISPAIYSLN